ncbi:MAG: DMT family transporter [Nitrincola lacisaponensis]|uniref:Membrane protein n=1 Tax=Nitrincola lacisaponensis TaxID=267850 RepID=A0A063Y2B9_9GAMM|nr:DMT family transporter [Nitrincola lacisaponensis]KDE39310.1 Membrane protein [Nitrincola lacisaponensis]
MQNEHTRELAEQATVQVNPSVELKLGILLVAAAAIVWSFGGALGRIVTAEDSWTIIFWRSIWASVFLLGFMLYRNRLSGTYRMFRYMGLPGLGVALCFATASTSFIVALKYTTVANILLIQAGVPLIAALMAWIIFREKVSLPTWIAIAVVILGVGVMVSESFTGQVSPIGDSLALLIAFCFATATVITRRYAHVRMAPAVCTGTLIAAVVSGTLASTLVTSTYDSGILFAFGALNLGLGLALFVTGARLLPSPVAALIGTAEPMLGPVWVWLFLNEIPSHMTLIGGAIILAALLAHLTWQMLHHRRVMVGPTPN